MNSQLDDVMEQLDQFLVGFGIQDERVERIGSIIDSAFDEIADGLRDAGLPVVRDRQPLVELSIEEEEEDEDATIYEESVDLMAEEEDPLLFQTHHTPEDIHWTDGEVFLRADYEDINFSPRRLSYSSDTTVDIIQFTAASLRQWEWYYNRDRPYDYDSDLDSDSDTWVDDTWVPCMTTPM
jgi:hypothetical protein